MRRLLFTVTCIGLAAFLTGCADTRYYLQSVRGHLQLMQAARPVDDWIAEPATPALLRSRLQLARRARRFAVEVLHLPDNPSYHRYADLGRRAAVWNVVAAPPLSLALHDWCFVVAGCVGYRGYFDEVAAQAEAARLQAQGLETLVYGVPAYSTLGWMNWAGGDPLLNTFIAYPEGDFVRLLFHELAHQVVYVAGDTEFNESFATAVERMGSARWLAVEAAPAERDAFALLQRNRAVFRALVRDTRAALERIYADSSAGKTPAAPAAALAAKRAAMDAFRARYAALRAQWVADDGGQARGLAGYDDWVARANNAAFAAQAAYDARVPAFEALFARQGGDWPHFYDAVRALAQLPRSERDARLAALTPP